LLLHAYTALSIPSIKGINKKVKQAISISKAKNKPSSTNQFPFPKTKSTLLYRQILERFCANIKSNSIEVLKLNRENKWQSRYLTVSKEGTWLKYNRTSGDRGFCPLGILWLKKMNSKNEYSISNIDKQGRGGILFFHLLDVVQCDILADYPLTRKQQSNFKDSTCLRFLVDQDDTSRNVTLCCSTSSCKEITDGCQAIINILKNTRKSGSKKKDPKSIKKGITTFGNKINVKSQQNNDMKKGHALYEV